MKTKIEIEIDACGKYCKHQCSFLDERDGVYSKCNIFLKLLKNKTNKTIRCDECIEAEQKGGQK